MANFQIGHLEFEYPDLWSVVADEATSVTVAGPGTAFCTVSLVDASVDPDDALDAVVDVYRQEYDAVDVYAEDELPHGRDVEFFALELCNTAWLRSYHAAAGTLVLVFQCTDIEVDEERPHFELIAGSLARLADAGG